MLGNNQFENFIVKQITHPISFNVDTMELQFNKIVASESVMRKIMEEGIRYGYTERKINDIVTRTVKKISDSPSIEVLHRNLSTENIGLGQHFKIVTHSDCAGEICIELCCIEPGRYLVLSSDDNTLIAGDELVPIMKSWNVCETIDFMIYRDNNLYPNASTIFRTAKISCFELYNPSAVYQIYDSEKDFSFDTIEKKEIKVFYANYPGIEDPIAYNDDDFSMDKLLPYRIEQNGNVASLSLNDIWINDKKSNMLDFITAVQSKEDSESAFIKEIDYNRGFKRIQQIQNGLLKQVYNINIGDIWIVEKVLMLDIIYDDEIG